MRKVLQNVNKFAFKNANAFRSFASTPALNDPPKILITGGRGQLGRALADELGVRYGTENVILTDLTKPSDEDIEKGYTKYLDVMNKSSFSKVVAENRVNWILHLPALLSAVGESNVPLAKAINVDSAFYAWEISKQYNCRLFVPSSIGAFGPASPLDNVPDQCIQDPTSFYGVSKIFIETMANYSTAMFKSESAAERAKGVDFRCLRFPGIISPVAEPGGGTTDYAVDIFHQVVGAGSDKFECFLPSHARLPMMLESDCIKGTCDYLAADIELLKLPYYNLSAVNFTPEEISNELKKTHDFEMIYDVDETREAIAKSWPKVFLDDGARADWGWVPEYDTLEKLTKCMIENVPRK